MVKLLLLMSIRLLARHARLMLLLVLLVGSIVLMMLVLQKLLLLRLACLTMLLVWPILRALACQLPPVLLNDLLKRLQLLGGNPTRELHQVLILQEHIRAIELLQVVLVLLLLLLLLLVLLLVLLVGMGVAMHVVHVVVDRLSLLRLLSLVLVHVGIGLLLLQVWLLLMAGLSHLHGSERVKVLLVPDIGLVLLVVLLLHVSMNLI